jgi:CHAD domain-containing protein
MNELRAARNELRRSTPPRDEAIHEARKSVKKVRAILQLIDADDGAGLANSQHQLQTVNRRLSRVRDADAMMSILDKLRSESPRLVSKRTFMRARRRLSSYKRAAMAAAARKRVWTKAGRDLRKLRQATKRWRPTHRGFGALEPGIRFTHRRGREAMVRARKGQRAADFHQWRKQIKALWYELRLIENCDRSVQRDVAALQRAETFLGDDHNVVVLCAELSKDASICDGPVDLSRLRLAADRYQCNLRRKAIGNAQRIYRRQSRKYVKGIKRVWKTWHRHG